MSLGSTETGLDYFKKHPGNFAEGICGVTEHWDDFLAEKNIKKNSLAACIEIYKFLVEKHDGNKRKAIIEYKGIKSKENLWIVDKVLDTKKQIKAVK